MDYVFEPLNGIEHVIQHHDWTANQWNPYCLCKTWRNDVISKSNFLSVAN